MALSEQVREQAAILRLIAKLAGLDERGDKALVFVGARFGKLAADHQNFFGLERRKFRRGRDGHG